MERRKKSNTYSRTGVEIHKCRGGKNRVGGEMPEISKITALL